MTPWTILSKLLCPGNFPGKDTGVGCHSLLQGIFPALGLNLGLLHCRQILYCLSHQGSFLREWVSFLKLKFGVRGTAMESLCVCELLLVEILASIIHSVFWTPDHTNCTSWEDISSFLLMFHLSSLSQNHNSPYPPSFCRLVHFSLYSCQVQSLHTTHVFNVSIWFLKNWSSPNSCLNSHTISAVDCLCFCVFRV